MYLVKRSPYPFIKDLRVYRHTVNSTENSSLQWAEICHNCVYNIYDKSTKIDIYIFKKHTKYSSLQTLPFGLFRLH